MRYMGWIWGAVLGVQIKDSTRPVHYSLRFYLHASFQPVRNAPVSCLSLDCAVVVHRALLLLSGQQDHHSPIRRHERVGAMGRQAEALVVEQVARRPRGSAESAALVDRVVQRPRERPQRDDDDVRVPKDVGLGARVDKKCGHCAKRRE